MLVRQLFLVLLDLTVDLVDQGIERGVHVFVHRIGKQLVTGHVNGRFSLLIQFLDTENDLSAGDVVEMPLDRCV